MAILNFKKPGQSGLTSQELKVHNFLEGLRDTVINSKLVPQSIGSRMVSLESIGDSDYEELDRVGIDVSNSLESIAGKLFGKPDEGFAGAADAATVAGTLAGMLASDYKAALARPFKDTHASTENYKVINLTAGDAVAKRTHSLEAYHEAENRNAMIFSMVYNYQSSRQDEFGETIWPTITLSNESVGFGITVNLMTIFDGVERKISGAVTEFNKKNIIRAVKNPNILKKDQTLVVPVHRAESAANFSTVIPASAYDLEGESINSAPLAFKKEIDLIGISQTEALLKTGVMNNTDSLEPAMWLKNVYVTVGDDDILRIPTLNLAYANFIVSPQDNYMKSNLNFQATSIIINKNTKNADGSALVDLAAIAAQDLVVQLKMDITGRCNIETGQTVVYGNSISVASVQDAGGAFLSLTSGVGKTVADLFAAAVLDSYDVKAYRTNMNRRQQGQLIDVTKYTQLYNIPLRSPVTSLHPINNDGSSDASDVQALIATTRIRMQNDAVGELLKVAETLSQLIDPRVNNDITNSLECIGRYYVLPTWASENIDMATAIDSIKSHERAADIQAVLVNKIRDMAYRMYRDSEYKAAADALGGGQGKLPTVILATDPVIARYINVEGDLRTLSGGFDVRIVSTLDERMQGKIAVLFGVFDENRNVAPNPLNFGNMIWAPEMVLSANISRSGVSKETVVQPRYGFVWHCPIMGLIQVTNIPAVLNSVALEVTLTNP